LIRMLERRVNGEGVVYYVSPRLESVGLRHAFSTRVGGCSPAPFDSLNLGNPNGISVQDDYRRIWVNYARLLTAIGCPSDPPVRVHQVHGNGVLRVVCNEPFDTGARSDGIVSGDASRAVSVRVADCVPVLLGTKSGRAVAAVHAGWRGVIAGVIPAAVRELLDISGEKSGDRLIAAIGPCIGFEAFEVGAEVLGEFSGKFGASAPIRECAGGKGRVDLRSAARMQLIEQGLDAGDIDTTDRCTYSHADDFFSHRRDHGITGRMAAIIAPSPQ
jgi:YfiH family protein